MSKLKTELSEQLAVLDELAARINKNAIDKGFYEAEHIYQMTSAVPEEILLLDDNTVGMKLALIHSEVTEILEAIRKRQGEAAIADEFADVLIRLLDLWHALSRTKLYGELGTLAEAVEAKVLKNEGREFKHGNRRF